MGRTEVTAHSQMLTAHGETAGRRCGDCQCLIQSGSRTKPGCATRLAILACRVFTKEHGRRAPWTRKWAACGAFRSVS